MIRHLVEGMYDKTAFTFAMNCPRAFRIISTLDKHASNKHKYCLDFVSIMLSFSLLLFLISVCQPPPDGSTSNSLMASSMESSQFQ